ncbi:hypothetical protein SAMN05216266_12315 [Amycolatopsis marina]|uniref:Uncharacterized protein n=1 Tax=Amycolatopsis marina TaxID=490629 RepID=A0A1I1CDZ3_9PSEU|nr:hypothetical protein [Amycolatopsis marina]SFB58970.1 hypothetical protein SAMN05216266_12315 [Amycolatopsis marina]
MPERSAAAQPGRVPGSRRDTGTLFAALYGEFVPHAWHDPEHDAYQLFYQRSRAMSWLDDTDLGGGVHDRTRHTPGLWGMNDAGWEHPLGTAGTALISWFQVSAGAVADDQPLPVQPFLRCAEDATARAGTPSLSAVQVLLPVQGIDPASRPPYAPVPSMGSLEWFAEGDPRSKTTVQVSINSGLDPAIPAVAQQLTDHLTRLRQDVFVCTSHHTTDRESTPAPACGDGLWNGPPLHGVMLHGDLAEWTCEAIGWTAEVIADSAARLGVQTPLLLTVTRTHPTN